MSLLNIFDVAGTALSAQSVRLNTTASNLANVDSVSSNTGDTYRARHPVFQTMFNQAIGGNSISSGVHVTDIAVSTAPLKKEYQPDHPQANEEGYIYMPNINPIEEMVNMISASRAYQNNVEVLNHSRDMLLRTLNIGQ